MVSRSTHLLDLGIPKERDMLSALHVLHGGCRGRGVEIYCYGDVFVVRRGSTLDHRVGKVSSDIYWHP